MIIRAHKPTSRQQSRKGCAPRQLTHKFNPKIASPPPPCPGPQSVCINYRFRERASGTPQYNLSGIPRRARACTCCREFRKSRTRAHAEICSACVQCPQSIPSLVSSRVGGGLQRRRRLPSRGGSLRALAGGCAVPCQILRVPPRGQYARKLTQPLYFALVRLHIFRIALMVKKSGSAAFLGG